MFDPASNIPPPPKLKAPKHKIIQILFAPNNSTYQGAFLGLGSDGVVYFCSDDGKWVKFIGAL